jgi:hypothetical protein
MEISYLNENEIKLIEAFCKNEEQFEAVRKVMLQGIYFHGVNVKGKKSNPLINGAFSLVALSPTNPIPNEEIGAQLRAQWAGINALESAMNNLKKIKSDTKENKEEELNQAI